MSDGTAVHKVLVVEDDAATAELERRALTRAGLQACVVGTVKDALVQLEQEAFFAVLLDYHLPDGDPWAVVERATAQEPRVPVVMVTAAGTERIAAEALHRGVADYVTKAESFWDSLPLVVHRVARLAHART